VRSCLPPSSLGHGDLQWHQGDELPCNRPCYLCKVLFFFSAKVAKNLYLLGKVSKVR